jgi:hypothetical protein
MDATCFRFVSIHSLIHRAVYQSNQGVQFRDSVTLRFQLFHFIIHIYAPSFIDRLGASLHLSVKLRLRDGTGTTTTILSDEVQPMETQLVPKTTRRLWLLIVKGSFSEHSSPNLTA